MLDLNNVAKNFVREFLKNLKKICENNFSKDICSNFVVLNDFPKTKIQKRTLKNLVLQI